MKHIVNLGVLIFYCLSLTPQKYVEVDGGYGFVVPHHADMWYYLKDHSFRFSMNYIVKRSSMLNQGNNIFKGLSLQYIKAGEKDLVGSSFGLAYNLRFPLERKKIFFLETRVGIEYNTIKYTEESFMFNALGTHLNALICIGLLGRFSFYRWEPFVHLSWNHYSNGAVTMPNLGLNIPILGVGIVYTFNQKPDSLVYGQNVRVPNLIDISISGSIKQRKYEGPHSPVFTLTLNKTFAFTQLSRWSGGLDFVYDQSIYDNLMLFKDTMVQSWDKLKIGYHLGWTYPVGWLEITLELGSYVKNFFFKKEQLFERLSYRYFFSERFGIYAALRAHYFKADVIEWGVICRL
ncbi:MAG: acyloxyacyl hydrolase [Bacteroidales bacterium]|nr:acyloxyacyl hydrolase [Bacteroidales bacterium]